MIKIGNISNGMHFILSYFKDFNITGMLANDIENYVDMKHKRHDKETMALR